MRTVFFGTPEFAVASLNALINSSHQVAAVVAQPDRPAGRGMRMQKPPVAVLAERARLPLVQPPKIRDAAFLAEIRSLRPDIGVVVAYGKILHVDLLLIPERGFINVHGSILPYYRGAAPIQRAIQSGEQETGVSIMRLDQEMDHGPVFSIARTHIGPDEHSPDVAARLAEIGAQELVRVLDAIEQGTATETEQDHDRATYASKILKEEGEVTWTERAFAIYDKFRAFDPWPGVSVSIGGEPVKLVEIAPLPNLSGEPGVILELDDDAVVVATGDGALRIAKLQRPGKGRVNGAEFARGMRRQPGERLQ